MAQNCLLTKLKGVVNDNTLPFVGVLKLKTTPSAGWTYISGNDVVVDRYGENGELISSTPGFDGTPNTEGYFLVRNKYGLIAMTVNNLQQAEISLADLSFCQNLQALSALKVVGDLSSLKNCANLANLQLVDNDSPVTGDLSVFNNCPNLNYIFFNQNSKVTGDVSVFSGRRMTGVTLYAPGVYGDIASFGSSITLTEMYINTSGITGTLESLADAQIAAGRTSGSLLVQCNGHLTLNGSVVQAGLPKTITFSEGSYSIA